MPKFLKNINCPRYSDCRDHAALTNRNFDCRICKDHASNGIKIQPHEQKLCSQCSNIYPRTSEFFWKDNRSPDGLDYTCKVCNKKNRGSPIRRFKKYSCFKCKNLRQCKYKFQPPCFKED